MLKAAIIFLVSTLWLTETASAASCSAADYNWPSQWSGGAGGNFFITFNSAATFWRVDVTFSAPVLGLQVWNGAKIVCASSTACKFENADWNINQPAGAKLTLGFQVTLTAGVPPPAVTSITVQGINQCGGSSPATTTKATTTIAGPTSSTTKGPTTTTKVPTTSTTVTSPPSSDQRGVFVRFPSKVVAQYILIADDTVSGFGSGANWTPQLFSYQQTALNVLYLTFIDPISMAVPPAFVNLAKTRGTGAAGAVPATTVLVFAIGGQYYSEGVYASWPWLQNQAAAEAMAAKVAQWPSLYKCDGIDLDIEGTAGNQANAGVNMAHFVRKLRQLVPTMYIGQPTYGYPQIEAENYVINQSWNANGVTSNMVDTIGLMVYEGATSLDWTKSYTNGPDQWIGFPITCRAPSNTILVGAKGITSAADIQTLASACIAKNYRGIMIWYGSVANGFAYEATWDTSKSSTSAAAFGSALASFKATG